jgi:hypothetical protein
MAPFSAGRGERQCGDARPQSLAVELRSAATVSPPHLSGDTAMMKGGLLWMIGIPLPIILILWFLGFLS